MATQPEIIHTEKLYNNGKFVRYNAIKDKNFIYDFIKCDCYSNSSNLETAVNKLVAYEDTISRSKNYCIYLQVMYPKDLSKNQQHEFAKKFMFEISMHYKTLLFAYKFVKRGKGLYVDIIAFERELYQKEKEIADTYARDMYINKNTGKTCSKDDPNALHICKKGAVKLDKDGNPKKLKVVISKRKTRYFNYNNSDDPALKKANFDNFRLRLCFKASQALSKIFSGYRGVRTLKYAKRSYGFSDVRTINTLMYNDAVSEINQELRKIQKIFLLRGALLDKAEAQKRFDKIWYSLDYINNAKQMKITQNSNYKINLSPTAKINACSEGYKETVNLFKDLCMSKIQQWYAEEFYVNQDAFKVTGTYKKESTSNIVWLIKSLTVIKNYSINCELLNKVEKVISNLKLMKKGKRSFSFDQISIREQFEKIMNSTDKSEMINDLLNNLEGAM